MDDARLKNHILRTVVGQPNDSTEIGDADGNIILSDVAYYSAYAVYHEYFPRHLETILTLSNGQALCSGLGPKVPRHAYLLSRVGLTRKDIERLDLAGACINGTLSSTEESDDPTCEDTPFDPFTHRDVSRGGPRLICQREGNMLSFDHLGDTLESMHKSGLYLLILAMIVIPTGYGGIHLAGLQGMFPTGSEHLLWKCSCFILLSFAAFLLVMLFSAFGVITIGVRKTSDILKTAKKNTAPPYDDRTGNTERRTNTVSGTIGFILAFETVSLALVCAGTVVYIAARIFIVVESFISLRLVPIGVYQTPPRNVMGYIPHL